MCNCDEMNVQSTCSESTNEDDLPNTKETKKIFTGNLRSKLRYNVGNLLIRSIQIKTKKIKPLKCLV